MKGCKFRVDAVGGQGWIIILMGSGWLLMFSAINFGVLCKIASR